MHDNNQLEIPHQTSLHFVKNMAPYNALQPM
jgi:hypothetical protein